MKNNSIISSQIPWNQIKGSNLENLLYWLLVEMGARDVNWRKGGTGEGAADGGRDLECFFYSTSIDRDMTRECWWIDAKGSKGTVPINKVKSVINNITAYPTVDKFIIATNSYFTNPTKDWVEKWQNSHKRPLIILWEKEDLERLCGENPSVVARLFVNSLNDQDKLDVAKSRFWTYLTYSDEPSLVEFWEKREELKYSIGSLFHLIASEFANGSIILRNWPMLFCPESALQELQNTIKNRSYLSTKASEHGTNQLHLEKATAYLILICIEKNGADIVASFLKKEWSTIEKIEAVLEKYENMTLIVIIQELIRKMWSNCIDNCGKLESFYNDIPNPKEEDWIGDKKPVIINERKMYYERADAYFVNEKKLCKINQNKKCPLIFGGGSEECLANLDDIFCHIEKIREHGKIAYDNKKMLVLSIRKAFNLNTI